MGKMNVLIVGMTATVGGLENFVIGYCEQMANSDVHFDFLTRFPHCAYDDRICAMGGTVYHVTRRSQNPIRYYREIRRFFAEHGGEYDVIWDHECMVNDLTPLRLAKKAGIPVRLYHSHNTQNMDVSLKGRVQGFLHRLNRRRLPVYINELWACSEEAIQWAAPDKRNVIARIVPNAIDTGRFDFNPQTRQACRSALALEDCYVVGHTGRLQYQKNQRFLLDAFAAMRGRVPQARLLLVGDGPDDAMLRQRTAELGLEHSVLFLGFRDDIPQLLQAMDLFAFTSRFEGLGISVIEAQTAGLPCIVSTQVPLAAHCTDMVSALPTTDPSVWADAMAEEAKKQRERHGRSAEIAKAGYQMTAAAPELLAHLQQLTSRYVRPEKDRYILSVPSTKQYAHALTKARVDTQRFANQYGFTSFVFKGGDTAYGHVLAAVKLVVQCTADWISVFFKVPRGATVLVQYPHFPLKSVPVARTATRLLQRMKHIRFIALVHDLDSLRAIGGKAAVYSDRRYLPLFDAVICHNEAMKSALCSMGLPKTRMVTLQMFDYWTDVKLLPRPYDRSVCIAGNLSRAKSGYLYQMLAQPSRQYELHLYGGSFEEAGGVAVTYHGVMGADELPARLQGAFGLIWDGDTMDRCSGVYGDYLRINAPHKMSLYLAAGIPVLIWDQAAQAHFVTEHDVGLTISSLHQLDALLASVTPEVYRRMAGNAAKLSPQICSGQFLTNALDAILPKVESGAEAGV